MANERPVPIVNDELRAGTRSFGAIILVNAIAGKQPVHRQPAEDAEKGPDQRGNAHTDDQRPEQ